MTDIRQILILVESDPALRGALCFSLGLEGFDVRPFESAEALLAAGPVPASACLVVEHRLPGLDGIALLERLRGEGSIGPAAILAGPRARIASAASIRLGARLIEKPLMCDALTAALRAQPALAA